MQMFVGQSFFVWLSLLSLPAFILGICEKQIKYYGMIASAILLWLTMGSNTAALAYLLMFVLAEYAVVQSYLRIRTGGNQSKAVYYLFLAMSILPLAGYKILEVIGNPYHILAFMGLSYMTFKVAQIVIETYDGIIREIRPFEYAYLLLFFPTILSGPIDRSRRFNEDLQRKIPRAEYLEMAGKGLYRILLGMVYKIVAAGILYTLMTQFGKGEDQLSVLIYFYTYGFYLFFDFAGYSLMAIGAGNLFGIEVPENFKRPFVSRNINEFWNRWHITLSFWLRDYVFSRITMALIRTRKIKSRLTITSMGFMANMLLMGCWHGLTSYYIAYGLYHGILLASYEAIRTKSSVYKKLRKKKWFGAIEWIVTLHLVLFGFFIFSGRLHQLMGWI